VETPKKKKKVNHLTLKECEDIISKSGGMKECLFVRHVLEQYNKLLVTKAFNK